MILMSDGGLRCNKLSSILCRKLSNTMHSNKKCLVVSTAPQSHKGHSRGREDDL